MESKIKVLIAELKQENKERSSSLSRGEFPYNSSIVIHEYNLTFEFIKRLEDLIH